MIRKHVPGLVLPVVMSAAACGGSGVPMNHGTINLNTFTLSFSARGRVCGDGL